MGDPPRDAQGRVTPYDDEDIHDDDGLLRYIDPLNHVVWDGNLGRYRVSSGAFSESSEPNGGMSVDLERLMAEAGIAANARAPDDSWGIARLQAGQMRKLKLQVGMDPIDSNPYHGEVWGIKSSHRKKILKSAELIKDFRL